MGVHIELQGLLVLDMRMLLMIALAFLPALVIGEEEKTAAANFQAVCDFYAKEIELLEKNKKELKDLVKLESVLYEKLNSSSGICNAIGYLALPDCALKEEGTKKQRVNVFDRLDDKCAEDKTNKITKSLKTVLGLGTEPSGQVVFRSCKDIFVKIILEQFKKMQGFISSQCDQSLSTGLARRKHSLGHASSGTDDHLLTLLLLGGLGGSHQPYHAYPSYKKRREVKDDEIAEVEVAQDGQGRR